MGVPGWRATTALWATTGSTPKVSAKMSPAPVRRHIAVHVMVNRSSESPAAPLTDTTIWPRHHGRGELRSGRVIGLVQKHLEQGAPHRWGGWRGSVIEEAEASGVMLLEELFDISSRQRSGNVSVHT